MRECACKSACEFVRVRVCLTEVCEFGRCCAYITLREGVSKSACALVCKFKFVGVRVGILWVGSFCGKLSDNDCINRKSFPGRTDGNDVFYHQTTDAAG